MFPQLQDPKGDPQKWTDEEMRVWLNNVCLHCFVICFYNTITDDWSQRNLQCTGKETREELLARIEANKRAPRV